MKRFLFSICILALSCTAAFAQTTVTKADFQAKVDQLNQQLSQSNLTQAQATYADLKSMMQTHLGDVKTSVQQAPNQQTIQAHMTTLKAEQHIYTDIIHLANDLVANQQAIHNKFVDFINNF